MSPMKESPSTMEYQKFLSILINIHFVFEVLDYLKFGKNKFMYPETSFLYYSTINHKVVSSNRDLGCLELYLHQVPYLFQLGILDFYILCVENFEKEK